MLLGAVVVMEEQLFQSPPGRKESPFAPQLQSVASQVTAMATRVKLAEERYANLSKRNQLTEASLLAFEREMKADLRAITRQSVELRRHLTDINAKVDAMLGELKGVVKKPELSVVERYVDLWQPMQFITREEAKRLIADAAAAREQAPR
jgi:hypothetical protein